MTVPRHLEEAASRLRDASRRIDAIREAPPSLDALKQWLAALTDYCLALSDIQSFNNESVHEKLHQIAGAVGMKTFARTRNARRKR